MDTIIRCSWAKSPRDIEYHDTMWGKPLHNERELFKMLILEGQQAGLSWSTILNKWDSFCAAYDDFDPAIMAGYGDEKIAELMNNAGVIRNKLKINAAVTNARAYLALVKEHGSLDTFLWGYVDGKPIVNHPIGLEDIPAKTPLSDRISKDLLKMGFKFVGSTIIYAYMQAIGMVNDHFVDCSFRGV